MNKDLRVYIKEGYQKFRTGVYSINMIKVTVEPNELCFFYKEIERDAKYPAVIPFEIIKETASRELAKNIVDNLVYKEEVQRGETIYTFSINDYSIKESKEKQQIINQLKDERDTLSVRVNELLDKNLELTHVNNYNSRSLFQKIKDYILNRKKFNLTLGEY